MDSVGESDIEKVYKAGLTFLSHTTLEEIYPIIVKEAVHLVGAESGTINLQIGNEFTVVYSTIPEFREIQARKEGYTYKTFISGKPVIVDIGDIGKAHPKLKKYNIRSSIFIPMSYQGKAVGVLTVNTSDKAFFDNKKLKMLTLFGAMASLAIKKAQLFEDMTKALESRDLFISMAGHELRTPLTSINGYTQLLKTKLTDMNTSEGRWVEQLSWECLRLTILIKELLTVNQIKSGQSAYDWKECSIVDIIERMSNDITFVYPHRNIKIINELERGKDLVIGDFDKLLQVFTNLLENAVKFSDNDSIVTLTAKSNETFISFSVTDHGIGIVNNELPRIFDKYYKGEHHSREGMGIGLFIVKDVIERHKGIIKVQTKVKKGTKVEIKLPLIKI